MLDGVLEQKKQNKTKQLKVKTRKHNKPWTLFK